MVVAPTHFVVWVTVSVECFGGTFCACESKNSPKFSSFDI